MRGLVTKNQLSQDICELQLVSIRAAKAGENRPTAALRSVFDRLDRRVGRVECRAMYFIAGIRIETITTL
jgi:hypothetical protein